MTPDQHRQLAAECNNERVKLIMTSPSALAIFGATFVVPALANPGVLLLPGPWIMMPVALAPHLEAQAVLRFLLGEE